MHVHLIHTKDSAGDFILASPRCRSHEDLGSVRGEEIMLSIDTTNTMTQRRYWLVDNEMYITI